MIPNSKKKVKVFNLSRLERKIKVIFRPRQNNKALLERRCREENDKDYGDTQETNIEGYNLVSIHVVCRQDIEKNIKIIQESLQQIYTFKNINPFISLWNDKKLVKVFADFVPEPYDSY